MATTWSSATRAGRRRWPVVAELRPRRAPTPPWGGQGRGHGGGNDTAEELPFGSVEPLAGKIVIDTNNYYPERDGHIPELDSESTTTSELLQAHLPTSRVVKAFNHIYAAELTTHGLPAGTKNHGPWSSQATMPRPMPQSPRSSTNSVSTSWTQAR